VIPRTPSQAELRRAEAATWGPRPAPKMRLLAWKAVVKNSLRGFVDIELPNGLNIFGIALMVGRNGPWASLPAKPQIDKDGRQKLDANSKAAYAPTLEWRDRELADRFSDAVVAILLEAHPDALDGGAA
jgi:hypothetical protein